jgi:hypothetical protein
MTEANLDEDALERRIDLAEDIRAMAREPEDAKYADGLEATADHVDPRDPEQIADDWEHRAMKTIHEFSQAIEE